MEDAVCLDREVCSSKLHQLSGQTARISRYRVGYRLRMDQLGRFCFTIYCCYGYQQSRPKVENHTDAISAGGRYMQTFIILLPLNRFVQRFGKRQFSESVLHTGKRTLFCLAAQILMPSRRCILMKTLNPTLFCLMSLVFY